MKTSAMLPNLLADGAFAISGTADLAVQHSLVGPDQTIYFVLSDPIDTSLLGVGWVLWLALFLCLAAYSARIFSTARSSEFLNEHINNEPAAQPMAQSKSNVDLSQFRPDHSVFSMIAAHDLRTPLRQQIALLEFLEEDLAAEFGNLPDAIGATLGQLVLSTQRMDHLITDLLDYCSKTDATGTRICLHDRIVEASALCALPEGFSVRVEGIIPDAYAPTAAVDTLIRNFISNAVKHHDRSTGEIIVSARVHGQQMELQFKDDGPGIEPDARERIFLAFERGPSRADGSGLGLALASSMARSWGGDVFVHANHPRGSVFSVTLPVYVQTSESAYPVTEKLAARARARGEPVSITDTIFQVTPDSKPKTAVAPPKIRRA